MRAALLTLIVLISACSDQADPSASVSEMHFATTSACSDYTAKKLSQLTNSIDFQYEFNKVEITLVEARSINGFFSLTSDRLDWSELAGIWFEVTKDCYSSSSITVNLGASEWALLQQQLRENGTAAQSYNAVLEDGKLTVYFEGNY